MFVKSCFDLISQGAIQFNLLIITNTKLPLSKTSILKHLCRLLALFFALSDENLVAVMNGERDLMDTALLVVDWNIDAESIIIKTH